VARNAFEELMLKTDYSLDPDAELKFRREFKAETDRYYEDKDRLTNHPNVNAEVEFDERQLQFNFVLTR
jgi:hypothetical protein